MRCLGGYNKGCVKLWPWHFTLKSTYLMAKEELLKLKYFNMERHFATQSQLFFIKIIKIKIQDNYF
jgi:hypothetical protein